jgi:hypothetical protein
VFDVKALARSRMKNSAEKSRDDAEDLPDKCVEPLWVQTAGVTLLT